MAIKLFLVDDHFIVREGLKLIFETEGQYDVIGEAESGQEALDKIKSINPDVILLDLNMPDLSGIDVLRVLKDLGVRIPVLILTTFDDQRYIQQAFSLGAKGYLLKDASRQEIMRSIDAVLRGEILIKEEISKALFDTKDERKSDLLTERETGILKEVASGKTSKAIAILFGISERTVKAHLTKIYEKLGVDSRANAVAKALSLGILDQKDL